MGKSTNINIYSDVATIFDAALAAGGEALYQTDSPASAHKFRARAYQFRKLLRELAAETCVPGQAPFTKYDHIVLQLDKTDPSKVVITQRKPAGVLTLPNGTPIVIGPAHDVIDDPLQEDVDALLDTLK